MQSNMAGKDVHMAGVVSNDTKPKPRFTMDSTILDAFPKLTNGKDSTRLDGGVTLLKHLHEQSCGDSDTGEFKYALSRLIRALGSSKTITRRGHYSTLAAFLTLHPEIPVETILERVDHELKPKGSNSKSENAEMHMGRILAYGAMIRSEFLLKTDNDMQLDILRKLIASGKQRSYLYFIAVSFLIEYINQVDSATLKATGWPVIEEELGKQWSEYTLDTLYLLLIMRDKFPSLISHKFLKKHLEIEDILATESMENVVKVLTNLPRILSCHHPVFKLVCSKLDTVELVTEFWQHIDTRFEKPSRTDEQLSIEVLKLILQNTTDKSVLPHLLTPKFLSHVLKKLLHYKKQSEGHDCSAAFKNILSLFVSSVSEKDVKTKAKLSVLKKLILYPGDIMIEKKTGVKVIQPISASLNLDGIKKLSKTFREIMGNTLPKETSNVKAERNWTNAERTYAAQLLTKLLAHPDITSDHEWRQEQLQFLFRYGLCEMINVGTELAPQFKDTFFRALDNKLPKLADSRNILSTLVHYIESGLKSNKLTLRKPLSEEASEAWNKVITLIGKWEKSGKETTALPIFHTMNLHMGLQLFSDPEMAIMSINELQSCYERLISKSKKRKITKKAPEEEEPEWVEVVIDLILSLLSRNNHLLRSLVGCVFPHICQYVTPTAIHQILAVFDVKNEKGPLAVKDNLDEEDEDVDEEESCDETSDHDSDDEDNEDEDNADCTEVSSEDSDSDADNESANEDENDTVTDRLRQAVSQALGDVPIQTENEDVNIDEIGEAEGKRLDESLAAAFKILRENRRTQPKKQEKSALTVMHFRVRAIDLLECYLENNPSMAVVLDMVVPLFALLEYCLKEAHQIPLYQRVRSCLKKLASVKKFKSTDGVDNELIMIILKSLIEKGERTTSVCQEMSDKLAECCIFLVKCAQQANVISDNVVQIYSDSLTAFFLKRDCILPAILFKSILQVHWDGNWKLAPLLVDYAFDRTVRPFRRAHALEFLTVFYNNNRLVYLDTTNTSARTELERKLCTNIIGMFTDLLNADKDQKDETASHSGLEIQKEVKQRYICILLNLLRIVYNRHAPNAWNWKEVGELLLTYRNQVSFAKDAKSAYNKLAVQLGIQNKQASKNKKAVELPKLNGHAVQEEVKEAEDDHKSDSSESEDESMEVESNGTSKKKKKKAKRNDKQQLKKETRLLREKTMSEGFETFQFSSFTVPDDQVDEGDIEQNGNTESKEITLSPHKRQRKHSSDIGSKPKRKKVIQTA